MKTFDATFDKDTVMTTSLLAIAIAWLALAAVHGPAPATRSDGTQPTAASMAAPLHAGEGQRRVS